MKGKDKQGQHEFEDIELSDPELREIENMKSDNEGGHKEEEEDVDIDALEKELHEADGPSGDHKGNTAPTEGVPPKQNAPVAVPLSAKAAAEKSLHGPENFFGNAIEIELTKVLPALKSTTDQSLLQEIANKTQTLEKVKAGIEQKAEAGEITPQKYLEILQKIHDKNKMLYQKASGEGAAKEDLTRINARIELMAEEIKEVKEGISAAGSEMIDKVEEKPAPQPTPATDNKSDSTKPSQPTPEKKEDFFGPASARQVPTEPKAVTPVETNPALLWFTQRISLFAAFLAYLQKYYPTERESDIFELEKKIEIMKAKLEALKAKPEDANIDQIDKEFPRLEPSFIIGMTREERNRRIESIFKEMIEDMKLIKVPKFFDAYKAHNKNLTQQLVEIRDSLFDPLPVISKKAFPIEFNDSNKDVERGFLQLHIKRILLPKADRYFFLSMSFNYEDKNFTENFAYNDAKGNYNIVKNYHLDDGKILKKFASESVKFTIHKRKLMFTSRVISSASVPLTRLKNYMDLPVTVEFDYKDGLKIAVEMEFKVNKALEKPMKDLYMYVIEKRVPAFTIPSVKKQEPQEERPAPKEPVKPVDTGANVNSSQKKDAPKPPAQTGEQAPGPAAPKPATEFRSKYKFPLLAGAEKLRLVNAVAKQKFDEIYCNYHLSAFCITFLEEFEKEVDAQVSEMAGEGDTAGRKEGQALTFKISQYKNFLTNSLENGKMSQNDYKEKVETFVKLDKQLLTFYEKNQCPQSAYFIRNRLAIMEEEVKAMNEGGV